MCCPLPPTPRAALLPCTQETQACATAVCYVALYHFSAMTRHVLPFWPFRHLVAAAHAAAAARPAPRSTRSKHAARLALPGRAEAPPRCPADGKTHFRTAATPLPTLLNEKMPGSDPRLWPSTGRGLRGYCHRRRQTKKGRGRQTLPSGALTTASSLPALRRQRLAHCYLARHDISSPAHHRPPT